MRSPDKFKGCLVGGAVGDALGYAVEFRSENSIFSLYGPEGIRRYDGEKGLVSDDTQMTLFTAAGLLLGTPEYSCGVFEGYPWFLALAYRDWYGTQTESYPLKHPSVKLAELPELFSRRAPGNTCLGSLGIFSSRGKYGSVQNRINHRKGCGGVMRAAPIGLYFCDSPFPIEQSDQLGAEAAAITHGHSLGFLPAALQSHIIRRIVEDGASIRDAVNDSLEALSKEYPDIFHLPHMLRRMEKAITLAGDPGTDDLSAIHQLGEGWVGDEALAIAVFCALRHSDDFEAAVIAAVNHGGDSDSTGAICGNIVGASLGYDAIPDFFKGEKLELHDVICSLAETLCTDEHIPYWTHHAEIDPAITLFQIFRRDFVEGQTYADYHRDVKKLLRLSAEDPQSEKILEILERQAGLIREAYDDKVPAVRVAEEIGL